MKRRLWWMFGALFLLSLAGATVLLIPLLAFRMLDFAEAIHLPVGAIANAGIIVIFLSFVIGAVGLLAMSVRALLFKRRS